MEIHVTAFTKTSNDVKKNNKKLQPQLGPNLISVEVCGYNTNFLQLVFFGQLCVKLLYILS